MLKNLFDLSGRRILVTGSNGGIGYSLALGLAEHGACVILNGRSTEKLHTAAERLRGQGLAVEEARFDVTDESEVAGGVALLDSQTWNEVLKTNLTSAMLVSREVVKRMIEKRAGKIINVCSLMSDVGRITTGPYTSAKGGLKMLTKAMCADWAQYNIQINAIGPGYFITEMTQVLADDPKFDGWVKQRTPAARWGIPSELIGAAVFLSSDASSFVDGQIIYVDGGMISVL